MLWGEYPNVLLFLKWGDDLMIDHVVPVLSHIIRVTRKHKAADWIVQRSPLCTEWFNALGHAMSIRVSAVAI